MAAQTSSSDNVGKSARISAVVAPSARLASTSFQRYARPFQGAAHNLRIPDMVVHGPDHFSATAVASMGGSGWRNRRTDPDRGYPVATRAQKTTKTLGIRCVSPRFRSDAGHFAGTHAPSWSRSHFRLARRRGLPSDKMKTMNFRLRNVARGVVAAFVLATAVPVASAQTPAAGRETSAASVASYALTDQMPVDPEVLVGALPNGLQVLRAAEPEAGAPGGIAPGRQGGLSA